MSDLSPADAVSIDPFEQFLLSARWAETLEDLAGAASDVGAKNQLFDFALNSREDYGHPSLDIILPDKRSPSRLRRLFVHETFPRPRQEDGEAILEAAGLKYFPVSARGDKFSAREVPLVTRRLTEHSATKPNAETIATHFLVPTLRALFDSQGLVPTGATMTNLAHVEHMTTVDGSDSIELGVRFIPPYDFESVGSAQFATTAIQNAHAYGKLVASHLEQQL